MSPIVEAALRPKPVYRRQVARGSIVTLRFIEGLVLLAIVSAAILVLPRLGFAQGLQFGADTTQDSPAKLSPRKPRGERDEDQLLAAAQYAHGRLLLQRDDQPGALKRYERAYRCDPKALPILNEIVPLASGLKRHSEAARYAIILAEQGPMDVDLLRQLGAILVEQDDLSRAAGLYEKAATLLSTKDSPDPGLTLLKGELGRLYLTLGKYDKAAEAFSMVRQALDNPEQFGFSRDQKKLFLNEKERLCALIGESCLRVQRFDDAEAMFRQALEKRSNDAILGFQLARIASEKKDWQVARQQLDKYFQAKISTAGVQPYELLGTILKGELGDPAKTQAALITSPTQLHESDPKNVPLTSSLASQLLEASEFDRAATLYEELLPIKPAVTAFRGLSRIHRQKKNAAGLVELYAQAIQREGSLDILGQEVDSLAKDVELIDRVVEVARTAPSNAQEKSAYSRFEAIALLAIAANKPAWVEEFYEKSLAQPQAPQSKIHETVGVSLLLSEQHLLAAKVLERAIAAQSANEKKAAFYYYLAGAYELGGNTTAALAAAEKCAELGADSAQFQGRAAWVLYHSKKLDEAEKRYLALIAKYDSNYQTDEVRDQMRQARFLLSNICVLRNRLPEAEEWLEQVLDEFPEDIGGFNDLGYLWVDQGKHLDRALSMCKRAVDGDPDNGAYRDSLGWAYFRHGQFAESIRELELASKATPDGVIFDHLGDAYLGAGNREKAVDAWKSAVEAFKKEQDLDREKKAAEKVRQNQTSKSKS